MAASWKQKLLGASVVSIVVVGTMVGCLSIFGSNSSQPSYANQAAVEKNQKIFERECGVDQNSAGYFDCELRVIDKLGRAADVANGKPEFDRDLYAEGAHTIRGMQYDLARDGIYLMSRSAGNAARCGVIQDWQVQRIIKNAISTRIKGDTSEIAARARRFASMGLQDPDCSIWADPRMVETERSVAATFAP